MKALFASAIALAATPLLAQTIDPVADANGDGFYSFPEMQVQMPDLTSETFTAIDTSGDGLVDAEELAAAVAGGLWPAMAE
jgi:carbohydrate-binding DOMON domain-containing protein